MQQRVVMGTAPQTTYLKKPHACEQNKEQYNQQREQNKKWSPKKKIKIRVPNPNSRCHATKCGLRVANANWKGHATKRALRVPNPNSRGHTTKREL